MKIYRGDHRVGEIELLEEVEVYNNEYITLYNDRVKFPCGQEGRYIRTRNAGEYGVCIMPVDNRGNILLIRQFRHAPRRWMWEIPKGFGELGLTPIECAKKELKEETGYTTDQWEHLLTWRGDTEKGNYLFRAVLDEVNKGEQDLEGGEAISEVSWFSQKEMINLINSGEMLDVETTHCIMHCLSNNLYLKH